MSGCQTVLSECQRHRWNCLIWYVNKLKISLTLIKLAFTIMHFLHFIVLLLFVHFMIGSIYVNGCLPATNIGKALPMALSWNKRGLQKKSEIKVSTKSFISTFKENTFQPRTVIEHSLHQFLNLVWGIFGLQIKRWQKMISYFLFLHIKSQTLQIGFLLSLSASSKTHSNFFSRQPSS